MYCIVFNRPVNVEHKKIHVSVLWIILASMLMSVSEYRELAHANYDSFYYPYIHWTSDFSYSKVFFLPLLLVEEVE